MADWFLPHVITIRKPTSMDIWLFQQWTRPYHKINLLTHTQPLASIWKWSFKLVLWHFDKFPKPLGHQGDFIFPSNLESEVSNRYSTTIWIHQYLFHPLKLLSLSLAGIFLELCKYGWEALFVDWYHLLEILHGQDNDMVGCTIQHSRDPHSQNILIIILWGVAGISQRPVMHILPIIPYLDNFWSNFPKPHFW